MGKNGKKSLGVVEIMITLAYILLNEQDYIERSILSAVGIADEIVVVDGGSDDLTVDICRGLGAKVFHFPWQDDFSASRNRAKELCEGDWILMLDADEHLEGEKLDIIRNAVDIAAENNIVAYQMPRKNHYPEHGSESPFYGPPFYPDLQTRLFANIESIFFSGTVHEGVVQSIECSGVGGIGRIPVTIHHHMFRGDKEKNEKAKGEYYEILMEKNRKSKDGQES